MTVGKFGHAGRDFHGALGGEAGFTGPEHGELEQRQPKPEIRVLDGHAGRGDLDAGRIPERARDEHAERYTAKSR